MKRNVLDLMPWEEVVFLRLATSLPRHFDFEIPVFTQDQMSDGASLVVKYVPKF